MFSLGPSVELPLGPDPFQRSAGWVAEHRPSWSFLAPTAGVPIRVERMRIFSLGLPVELPVGHDPFEG